MRRALAIAVIGVAVALVLVGVRVFWRDELPPGISQTRDLNDMRMTMYLDDAQVGMRVVTVLLEDRAGNHIDAHSVQLQFSMEEMDMGTLTAQAERIAAGRFQANGSFFSMVGRWRVDATVQQNGSSTQTAAFVFPIAAPGEASGPLNPLVADEPTLTAARRLYADNCAACHGVTGKADGPAAVGLRPAPGDFSQHMQVGKHTDGQVFLWIRDGYPGTAMPAWRERLTEQQIWQLVTFIRTFARDVTPEAQNAVSPTPVLPATTPEAAAPLPPLIFVRQGNVWRSDGSNTAPQSITALDGGLYAEYPTLAPNGQQIAFVATTQGPLGEEDWPLTDPETSLYLVNSDGTNQRLIWKPERGRLGLTAWSPDGAAVYVGVYDVRSAPDAPVLDRGFYVMRVDAQTGESAIALEDAYDLTFAANGTQIAFLRWHADRARFTLNVAAPDGSNEREVLSDTTFSGLYAPRFSPDARQIIFTSTSGPSVDEQGVPIKTSDRSLIDQMLGLVAPVAEAHGAAAELWIVNVDGSGLQRLSSLREDTPMAIFAPDGTQIVLMGAGGIYQINADGSNPRKIDPLGDHGGLDWGSR